MGCRKKNIHLSPEIQLLLYISSPSDLTPDKIDIDSLVSSCNPEILYKLSIDNNILLMLGKEKNRELLTKLPQSFQDRFNHAFLINSSLNLQMSLELIDIIRALRNSNISVLPFKGPVISQMLYADIQYRSFSDIDLLISTKDISITIKILNKLGFTETIPEKGLKNINGYRKTETYFNLVDPQKQLTIDLHWDCTNKYALRALTFDDVKLSTQNISLCGHQIPVLSDEDTLLHQCIHASSHRFNKLEYISAISHLFRQNLDWEKVLNNAVQLRANRMISVGAYLSQELFSIKLPEPIQQMLNKDAQAIEIAQKIIHQIDAQHLQDDYNYHKIHWRFDLYHFTIRSSFYDKYIHLIRLLFRPTIKEWELYPKFSWIWPIYIAIRPFRLILTSISKVGE